VKDENGEKGGFLDLRTGEVGETTPVSEAVLRQLLPHYAGEEAGDDLSVEEVESSVASLRRFAADRRRRSCPWSSVGTGRSTAGAGCTCIVCTPARRRPISDGLTSVRAECTPTWPAWSRSSAIAANNSKRSSR
jgi:hypothetical protein